MVNLLHLWLICYMYGYNSACVVIMLHMWIQCSVLQFYPFTILPIKILSFYSFTPLHCYLFLMLPNYNTILPCYNITLLQCYPFIHLPITKLPLYNVTHYTATPLQCYPFIHLPITKLPLYNVTFPLCSAPTGTP